MPRERVRDENTVFSRVKEFRRRFLFVILWVVICMIVGGGCGSRGPLEQLQEKPAYADWKIYTYKNVRLLYPPDHLHIALFDSFCQNLLGGARRISASLQLPPFEDTLYVVYYTGYGQGRELTGYPWPHAEGGIIHYWQPCYPGLPLADLLLKRWSTVDATGRLPWHGLRVLLDLTGRDYHAETRQIIGNGSFEPLSELAVDTTIMSDSERVQSAEAASLVAYIATTYGFDRLKMLYESPERFDQAVGDLLQTDLGTLETDWLKYIKTLTPPDAPDTTSS